MPSNPAADRPVAAAGRPVAASVDAPTLGDLKDRLLPGEPHGAARRKGAYGLYAKQSSGGPPRGRGGPPRGR